MGVNGSVDLIALILMLSVTHICIPVVMINVTGLAYILLLESMVIIVKEDSCSKMTLFPMI